MAIRVRAPTVPPTNHLFGRTGWDVQNFSPASLQGLVFWEKGSAGVVSAGGNVSAWNDQSGLGNNFTQTTGADQPTVGSINGRTAIASVPSECLTGPATFPNGAKTIALVFKLAALPGAGAFFSGFTLKSSTPLFSEFLFSNLGGAYQPYSWIEDTAPLAASAGVGIANALDTNAHALLFTFDGVATFTASLDNAAQAVVASGTINRVATDVSSLFARAAAANGAGTQTMSGAIGEITIYNRVLASAEQTNLIHYLGQSWGLGF